MERTQVPERRFTRHDEGLKRDPLLKSRRKQQLILFSSAREQKRIDCLLKKKKTIVEKLERRRVGKLKTDREKLDRSVLSGLIWIRMGPMDETCGTHGGGEKFVQSFGCKI